MKKIVLLLIFVTLLMSSTFQVTASTISKNSIERESNGTFHRGFFQAEIGLRNESEERITLEGKFRDFWNIHLISGTINLTGTQRSGRFQGFASRNFFIIQTAVRSHIVNIFGKFNSFDEEDQLYNGIWRGFVWGIGRGSGWITASFQ
jgi:hypothetical protein